MEGVIGCQLPEAIPDTAAGVKQKQTWGSSIAAMRLQREQPGGVELEVQVGRGSAGYFHLYSLDQGKGHQLEA